MPLDVMAVTHLRVFALPADFDATFEFYRSVLGFELAFCDAESGVAMFKIGKLGLLVERVDDAGSEARELVPRFTGISFRVSDIARAHQLLTELGVSVAGSPEKQAWGGTLLHARDPAGNVITLCEFD